MRWRPDRYGDLGALLRGVRVEEDIREEFEHHLAERIAANEARGMTPRDAREDALRRFGDMERFGNETRAIDQSIQREERRMEVLGTFRRELGQAWRGLARSPGFTLVAILTLGMGIGASAAVFTLLDRAVLSPLPYPAPAELVRIDHPVPGVDDGAHWDLASASYFQFRERAQTLADVGIHAATSSNVRVGESATQADVVLLSANLFDMLGARPALGRLLGQADDRADAAQVAVLSWEYWQNELGGNPRVIGETLAWEGQPVEIVGVAARGFKILEQEADIYLATRFDPAGPHFNSHYLAGIGRMRPGVTLPAVEAELAQLTADLPQAYPSVYSAGFMEGTRFGVRVRDLRAAVVGDFGRVLWIALGSVLLVLVIASMNVANLFLVRAEARRSEQTIRRALGASQRHLAVQSFAESIIIALFAGALGAWLAYGAMKLVVAMAPSSLPRIHDAGLTGTTLGFVVALAGASAAVFAIFPVVGRANWALLREGARGSTASRRQMRARASLVAVQIALGVVLLSAAGLMLRSFTALRATESGLDADGVLTVGISLPSVPYDEDAVATRYWETLAGRVAEMPGVTQVGATSRIPLISDKAGCAVMTATPAVSTQARLGCVPMTVAAPGYFEALGIGVEGRVPTWNDIRTGSGAVVVSRSLADALWPGESALGRGVRVPNTGDAFYRIVGIAEDVRHEGLQRPAPQMVYYPVQAIEGAPLWGVRTSLVLLVRTAGGDPVQLTAAVRRVARELEPAAAVSDVRTMNEVVARSMGRTSFTMMLLAVAGIMALVLSVVGLYGVVAYTVDRRRAEIGVRMALGADTSRVGGMVVLEALRLGLVGVVLGLAGAALTTGALRSMLFGVEPLDVPTLGAVALLLLTVAGAASLVPARRAARIDPLDALRG